MTKFVEMFSSIAVSYQCNSGMSAAVIFFDWY